MDHDSLLALFRKIALATAPLLVGCGSMGNCPRRVDDTVPLEQFHRDAAVADAALSDAELQALCMQVGISPLQTCEVVNADGGLAIHVVYTMLCAGRRPAGLGAAAVTPATSAVGTWLASMAYLEAAVTAAADLRDAAGLPDAEDAVRMTRDLFAHLA